MTWDGKERRSGGRDYDDIIIRLERIQQEMSSNHKSFREFEKEVKDMNHRIQSTVYGNGQVGLVTKVSSIEDLKRDVKWQGKIIYMGLGALGIFQVVISIFK